MTWINQNWFKIFLPLILGLLLYGYLFQRYEFISIQITETKEIIQKCSKITGKCDAATPLTPEGLRDTLGL